MRLEFTYTGKDFDELWKIKWPEEARRRRWSAWGGAIYLVVMLVLFLLFTLHLPLSRVASANLPWAPSGAFDWKGDSNLPYMFGIGVTISLTIYYVVRRHRKFGAAYLRSHPIAEQPQAILIGDEFVDASTPLGSAQYRWASFTNWAETSNLFALRLTGKHGILVLPKRAATNEQQKELRQLFRNRIINPTGGFPVTAPSDSRVNA
jgi:hypothetical protein